MQKLQLGLKPGIAGTQGRGCSDLKGRGRAWAGVLLGSPFSRGRWRSPEGPSSAQSLAEPSPHTQTPAPEQRHQAHDSSNLGFEPAPCRPVWSSQNACQEGAAPSVCAGMDGAQEPYEALLLSWHPILRPKSCPEPREPMANSRPAPSTVRTSCM